MPENNTVSQIKIDKSAISFRKQSGVTDCWQPIGTEWRTTAGAWLVTHDLYHHQPGDQGSLAEELATLGAEYYINHELTTDLTDQDLVDLPPPGLNPVSRSAAGIVGIALECDTISVEDLVLSLASPTPVANSIAERVFQAAAESALAELDYIAPDPDFPEWAAVRNAFSLEVVASWIRAGYWQAQKRFPDQARVRNAFEEGLKLIKQLSTTVEIGTVMTFNLSGYNVEVIEE